MPLALSAEQLDHVLALAQPIDPKLRSEFSQSVAHELDRQANGEIGPGLVHRVAEFGTAEALLRALNLRSRLRGPSPTARKARV
jgi:hypothetical protein